MMNYREAVPGDIPRLKFIRFAVKENILNDLSLVTDQDYMDYMIIRGKAWVGEEDGVIAGFCYVDMQENNVWALFVLPEYEGRGIGKTLLNILLEWYFNQTKETIWLGTDPNTRAARFYEMQGWKHAGMHGRELKFEMDFHSWNRNASISHENLTNNN